MSASVFDQIGGTPALKATVAVLYDRIVADPQLAQWFEAVDLRRLKGHQQLFLTAALGGPDEFGGRSLRQAHEGMAITHAAFDRLGEHLQASLRDLGLPADATGVILERVESLRGEVVEDAGVAS